MRPIWKLRRFTHLFFLIGSIVRHNALSHDFSLHHSSDKTLKKIVQGPSLHVTILTCQPYTLTLNKAFFYFTDYASAAFDKSVLTPV